MTAFLSVICGISLFVFIGFLFFSGLMFTGDGTEHPIKDGFKALGLSFVGLLVFLVTLLMLISPFNQTMVKEALPLNKTFVSFGDDDHLTFDGKPDLAYPLSDSETQVLLRTEHYATLQPLDQAIDKVEFNTSKPVTKAILETRQNAFGLTQEVLVLE